MNFRLRNISNVQSVSEQLSNKGKQLTTHLFGKEKRLSNFSLQMFSAFNKCKPRPTWYPLLRSRGRKKKKEEKSEGDERETISEASRTPQLRIRRVYFSQRWKIDDKFFHTPFLFFTPSAKAFHFFISLARFPFITAPMSGDLACFNEIYSRTILIGSIIIPFYLHQKSWVTSREEAVKCILKTVFRRHVAHKLSRVTFLFLTPIKDYENPLFPIPYCYLVIFKLLFHHS